jgi:hypothetical protein
MPDQRRRVLVISDLHVGSTLAVCPRVFVTAEEITVKPGPTMAWLQDRWDEFEAWCCAECDEGRTDLVLNGDLIEGVHHRTTQIWSNDPSDHVRAADKLLTQLVEKVQATGGRVFVVQGTETHTGPNSEHGLAFSLGAIGPATRGAQAWSRLDLTVEDVPCSFVHHFPVSTRQHLYATGLGVMLSEFQGQAARHGGRIPRVVCGAHRHTYGYYRDGSGVSLTTPAWQLLTRFGHKVVPAAACRVGGVCLRFPGGGQLPEVGEWIRALPQQEAPQ